MINKKQLLKEILENNPELKDKKKSIIALIDLLIKNNPNIVPDEKFKSDLQLKLDTITGIKQVNIKKPVFITGLIQALSLAFIIGGYYYFIGGMDFFDKDGKVEINNLQPEENIDKLKVDINNNIEDTQIIDLLGEPEQVENQGFGGAVREMGEPMMKAVINNFDESLENNLVEPKESKNAESDIILDENINNLEQSISFKEFCNKNFGELIKIEDVSICIVEGKKCVELDYINGVCNFIQIK